MSDERRVVWLACSGEYEQWGPDAAFATEELAKAYSSDVIEFEVWERTPLAVTHYLFEGVRDPTGAAVSQALAIWGSGHRRQLWAVRSKSWESNEVHAPEPASTPVISWWNGSGGPIFVEVTGHNKEDCRALFDATCAEVDAGHLAPEPSRAKEDT